MYCFKTEIVINVEFGGFSFDKMIMDCLVRDYGWVIAGDNFYGPGSVVDGVLIDSAVPLVVRFSDDFYMITDTVEMMVRSNTDVISVVKSLKASRAGLGYLERRASQCKVDDLKVVKVGVMIGVENVYDGKEQVVVDHCCDG